MRSLLHGCWDTVRDSCNHDLRGSLLRDCWPRKFSRMMFSVPSPALRTDRERTMARLPQFSGQP